MLKEIPFFLFIVLCFFQTALGVFLPSFCLCCF